MEVDGVLLIAKSASSGASYDVPLVDAKAGLEKLKKALALVMGQSPFSRRQIRRLAANGPVVIIYDPSYPKPKADFAMINVAVFLPRLLDKVKRLGAGKKFPTVVGRHGIKWPLKELGAVLVHELVGHGIQHLKNRRDVMRLGDMECEAWLYEEMAYQDFGLDKFSSEMIRFRKELDGQCRNFSRYLREKDPKGLKLWENLNPNVPKLLNSFEAYLKDLKRRGVIKKAKRTFRRASKAEK